ncbi:hypothetical protein IWZ03DRAFT_338177 [Phyllosticta citriasiana]|uniref:NACHT domain-containing protein n=1 Tax=Phyllosticta citriasiana TaxID=595635 RepID=A0ABR1L0V9_9PEZI
MVALAVKNCPEASLAWAAVTLCLPFFTKRSEATSACYDGLFYIASRMDYFVALESEIAKFPKRDQKRFISSILELYVQVLDFQFRCIWRLYTSSWKTLARDMLDWDTWTQKLASIQEKETKIQHDAQDCGRNLSREELSKRGKVIEDKFDELIEIQQQQQQLLQALLRCSRLLARIDCGDYKYAIPERISGTCEWLPNNPKFYAWLRGDSTTLLIYLNPGMGKSVLAKYLADSVLPRSGVQICNFFFKAGIEKATTLNMALCALIKQLFAGDQSLMRHAVDVYNKIGERMVESVSALWEILLNASLNSQSGVVCVIDAFNECREEDRQTFQELLGKLRRSNSENRLRFIITSRPYESIVHGLGAPDFGDDEDYENVRQETRLYIQKRTEIFQALGWTDDLASYLKSRLLQFGCPTFLWLQLAFEMFGPSPGTNHTRSINRTKIGVDKILKRLPTNLKDTYETALSLTPDAKYLHKALCIIIAARKPLMVRAMNLAMEISEQTESWDDIDCEDDEVFAKRLVVAGCGLISIAKGKVFLRHLTVREFLETSTESPPNFCGKKTQWHQSIHLAHANYELAILTSKYLDALEYPIPLGPGLHRPPFGSYAAKYWTTHIQAVLETGNFSFFKKFAADLGCFKNKFEEMERYRIESREE